MRQGLQAVLLGVLSLAQIGAARAQDVPLAPVFETAPALLGATERSENPSPLGAMPSAAMLSATMPSATMPSATRSAYVLGPDDEITVKVLEADEISGDPLRVDLAGYVSLPLIGRVRAAGLTAEGLEAELSRRLNIYIREPQVTVGISGLRSQPVSVIGAVNSPGVHQLEGRKTLIEILSLAGGLRDDAGHKVKITRRIEWGAVPLPAAKNDATGQFSTAEVSLQEVMEARNPAENVLIMPHDVITVPRAEMIYVIGGVHRSGGFVLNERESITVLQALALAGGLQATAKKKASKILRPGEPGTQRSEIAVNLREIMAGDSLDVPLEREDILFVPHSGGKAAIRQVAAAGLSMGTGMMIWRVGR